MSCKSVVLQDICNEHGQSGELFLNNTNFYLILGIARDFKKVRKCDLVGQRSVAGRLPVGPQLPELVGQSQN
jgi:hypothetical protein